MKTSLLDTSFKSLLNRVSMAFRCAAQRDSASFNSPPLKFEFLLNDLALCKIQVTQL